MFLGVQEPYTLIAKSCVQNKGQNKGKKGPIRKYPKPLALYLGLKP